MKLKNIEREVTYRFTDEENAEHCYTIAYSMSHDEDQSTTHIYGTHPYEEIEISNIELPYFAKAINLFLEEYTHK